MRLLRFDVTAFTSWNISGMDKIAGMNDLIPEANGQAWEDILPARYYATEPAANTYGVYALYFLMTMTSEEDLYDQTKTAVLDFLTDNFGKNDVLSIKTEKNGEDYAFHALIYPLLGRKLVVEDWIDPDTEGGYVPNDRLIHLYVTAMRDAFSQAVTVAFWDENETEAIQADSGPQVDLISKMSFAPPKETDKKEQIYDAMEMDKQRTTDMPIDVYLQLEQHTIEYFTIGVEKSLYIQAQEGSVTPNEFMHEVDNFLFRTRHDISDHDKQMIKDRVYSAVFGNYILEPLLAAEDISDIKVIDPYHIRVKCNGVRMTSNITFLNGQDYNRFIDSLAARNGLNLHANAFNVFTDASTNKDFIMRFNITTPLVNSSPYAYLHIRKIRKKKYTLSDLVAMGCMPSYVADYLRYKINTSSIIFCGKGGSGKTTIMNTLLEEISYGSSGLVIQESEELFSEHHPDFMFQHVVHGNGNFKGYDLRDMAQNGLLTDLDYFIIGEIKGGEALYFLNAAMTGHKCCCSVHAPSSVDAIDKLADYVMYESSYSKSQATYMLKELKTIVYLEDFKVTEISEIDGWDEQEKRLTYKLMYKR